MYELILIYLAFKVQKIFIFNQQNKLYFKNEDFKIHEIFSRKLEIRINIRIIKLYELFIFTLYIILILINYVFKRYKLNR